MTDEGTIDVSDRPLAEPTEANTGGLATRFVSDGLGEPPRASAPAAGHEPDPEQVVEPEVPGPSRRRDGKGLLRAGLVVSTAGLCLLLFVVYVYGFSSLQEQRAQRALLNEFTLTTRHTILSGRVPSEGRPAGILTIPAIKLDQVVVAGTTATDLLSGPGLMPGTARPGSLGNAVIAGHRSIAGSPFARLNRLHHGDRILVVTGMGRYTYRVIAVGSVEPGARDPISPNRHPRLTLVTSGGSSASDGRTYVVASLTTTPNRAPVPRHPPTAAERGLSGDSSAILPSVIWGIVLAAGFAATFWAYWRYRRNAWSVYMLSTPVLLAMAFLWYENLIRLLPGTM